MEQVRPGSRKALEYLEHITEAEVDEFHQGQLGRSNVADSIADMYDLSDNRPKFPDLKGKLSRLNEDLWAIQVAKTDKSEVADKLKGVREGEGLWAYVRTHKWFNQTTEQGMVSKKVNIMNPDLVEHDWEVVAAIEGWEKKCRAMMETEGEEELPEKYKMASIRLMLSETSRNTWSRKYPNSRRTPSSEQS